MDKLPTDGPALLIYYHGALPLDMYYILARLQLCKKRRLRNVAATFLFHVPGNRIALHLEESAVGVLYEVSQSINQSNQSMNQSINQ